MLTEQEALILWQEDKPKRKRRKPVAIRCMVSAGIKSHKWKGSAYTTHVESLCGPVSKSSTVWFTISADETPAERQRRERIIGKLKENGYKRIMVVKEAAGAA